MTNAIYVLAVISAALLATAALIPALLVAGVALAIALRSEMLWAGGKLASIKAPRPKLAPVEARRARV